MSIEVPPGWSSTPLKNLGSTYSGLAGKSKADFGKGNPFVTYKQVFSGGVIDLDDCDFVSVDGNEHQHRVRSGDVLFTTSSETPEEVAYSAVVLGEVPELYLNSFCFGFRPISPDKLWPEFSTYLFRGPSFRQAAVQLGQGSTRFNISKSRLMELQLPLPPLPEQKEIAAILSSVDEAIQATRAVIEQTRRVKEGLLQDLLTRGVGHTRFQQTEIGEIPEGWEVRPLGSLLANSPRNGLSPKTSEVGLPTFSIAAIRDGSVDIDDNLKFADVDPKRAAPFKVRRGDILLVRGNANPDLVASAGMVEEHPEGCIYPDLLMRLVPGDEIDPAFLLLSINSRPVHERFLRKAKTTNGTLKVNGRDVSTTELSLPTLPEQRQIVCRINAVTALLSSSSAELLRLTSLKAGLLQDLLTGKVRVSV